MGTEKKEIIFWIREEDKKLFETISEELSSEINLNIYKEGAGYESFKGLYEGSLNIPEDVGKIKQMFVIAKLGNNSARISGHSIYTRDILIEPNCTRVEEDGKGTYHLGLAGGDEGNIICNIFVSYYTRLSPIQQITEKDKRLFLYK